MHVHTISERKEAFASKGPTTIRRTQIATSQATLFPTVLNTPSYNYHAFYFELHLLLALHSEDLAQL